jgi:oligogalacturonide lyase
MMKSATWFLSILLALGHLSLAASAPAETRDPETGARIVLLSKIPSGSAGAGVIYFTQPCISPDSRYALVRYLEPSGGHTAGYMYRYDFKTGELTKLTDLLTRDQVLAPASGNMYFSSGGPKADTSLYATNIYDLKTRKVADMPEGIFCDSGLAINSEETTVVCTAKSRADAVKTASSLPPNQGPQFGANFNRHDLNLLMAADVKTGKLTELHRIETWLGHPQFSPTDPKLLLYCHEGPWAKVDRIWLLRLGDSSGPRLVLKRTEENEIAGHEFWSSDGKMVFFDHNYRKTPGKNYLEGKSIEGSDSVQFQIEPLFKSIHYTQSPDGKFFVCDGGPRPNPKDQGMFIIVPKPGQAGAGTGVKEFESVKLCSMAGHNYKAAEPNPHLSPDQHWVLFTATFSGPPQAYALEMPKRFWR